MLNNANFLRAAGGRLIANDPEVDRTLADIFAIAGKGDAEIGIKGIAVPLMARGGQRHIAHVLPLTSGARRRAGTSYAAVAALFVHKAALIHPRRRKRSQRPISSRRWNCEFFWQSSRSVAFPRSPRRSGSPETTARPISAGSTERLMLAARPIWSSLSQGFPIRCSTDPCGIPDAAIGGRDHLTVRLSLLSTADEVIELFAMRQLTLQLVAMGQERHF